MKKCSTCKEVKDDSEFYKDSSRYGGLGYKCKQCTREYQTQYRQEHKGLYRKGGPRQDTRKGSRRAPGSLQRYKQANREKVNAWEREYNARHSEERKAKSKEYNEQNRHVYLAGKTVQRAVRHKILPPASTCDCADCGKQARHYHHESYAEQDRLNVVALCSRCHKLRHMSKQIAA